MKRLLVLLVCIPVFGYSQSSVSGVVSYYYNQYQGNKPDMGAKVYIIDDKQAWFNAGSIDTFTKANYHRDLIEQVKEYTTKYEQAISLYNGKKKYKDLMDKSKIELDSMNKIIDESNAELTRLGMNNDQSLTALDKRLSSMLEQLSDDNAIMRTVDATGNYSANVQPGIYYVFIKSKNRNATNRTEILGKIYLKKITVKAGETKDVSTNFEM